MMCAARAADRYTRLRQRAVLLFEPSQRFIAALIGIGVENKKAGFIAGGQADIQRRQFSPPAVYQNGIGSGVVAAARPADRRLALRLQTKDSPTYGVVVEGGLV